jgi:hypothetical protein
VDHFFLPNNYFLSKNHSQISSPTFSLKLHIITRFKLSKALQTLCTITPNISHSYSKRMFPQIPLISALWLSNKNDERADGNAGSVFERSSHI